MDIKSWKTQLRKGAAELVVLAVLEKQPLYGLAILQAIGEDSGVGVSEGSLYPLLNKLHKLGRISSEWIEDVGATHPRKYYQLTDNGRDNLTAMRIAWAEFSTGINTILEA